MLKEFRSLHIGTLRVGRGRLINKVPQSRLAVCLFERDFEGMSS